MTRESTGGREKEKEEERRKRGRQVKHRGHESGGCPGAQVTSEINPNQWMLPAKRRRGRKVTSLILMF
jgi:hypothetical protein